MQMVGRRVEFSGWSKSGEEITIQGVVEDVFSEPPEEDPYERLNYRVREDSGEVHTPYASECELVR